MKGLVSSPRSIVMAGSQGYNRDAEINRILAENRTLLSDLSQCQADKDFVWSLWKKLQKTNPNITEAVGLVMQRDKEKAEIKDRKVLEILQLKDDKIEDLQNALATKNHEINIFNSSISELEDDIKRLQREIGNLRDQKATLELEVQSSQEQARTLDNFQKKSLHDADKDRKDSQQRLQTLSKELESARAEKADEMALRIQLENKVRVLERDVSDKITKFEKMIKELEETKLFLRRYESQVAQMQQEVDFKNQELETVRRELSELWLSHNQLTEHSSQQADLIRQMQSLQTDTQQIMKNQEDAYSMETNSLQQLYSEMSGRYEISKKTEAELRHRVLALKKEILGKDNVISELQSKLDAAAEQRSSTRRSRSHSGSFLDEESEPVIDLKYKVERLHKELEEKERIIERLERQGGEHSIVFDTERLNRHERTHSTPARQFRSIALSPMKSIELVQKSKRSQSMSPLRTSKDTKKKIFHLEKSLEDARDMIKLKNRELEELKKAHSKRLERLKSVQESYRLVKEQLKTLEAEHYGKSLQDPDLHKSKFLNSETKKPTKKHKRATSKELQREDSDAVWNELAFVKNENRGIVVEKMALEEDCDTLRVQASQDAATIHELRVQLQQEKEERAFEKKKLERDVREKNDSQSQITLLNSEVQNKEVALGRLERDLRDVKAERDSLNEEKRNLKSEIVDLKQEAAQHRMDTADMKREISRLKRELEEEQSIKQMASVSRQPRTVVHKRVSKINRRNGKVKGNVAISKQYQKVLNKSIEQMREILPDFDEEGWEEVMETEEGETEVTESDTLGQSIAARSKAGQGQETDSNSSQEIRPKQQPTRSVPMKQSLRAKRASGHHIQRIRQQDLQPASMSNSDSVVLLRKVVLRDMGTSPMTSPVKEKSPSFSARRRISSSPSQASRQLKALKQRIGYLQQQVITLRDSRSAALKSLEEHKAANTQLQSDLNLANQRLRVSKQSFQKLNMEIEKIQKDRLDLESKLAMKNEASVTHGSDQHTEQDWKIMETRLKVSSNEFSRQTGLVRQLKQDNEASQEQIKTLQEKISRLERDNNQKRTLLEDQRTRLRLAQDNAKSDANSLEERETKVKLLQDSIEKMKVQIESYKKRLGAVTREKRDYEERFLKLTADIEKKSHQLMECQNKKMELESSLTELEKTAQQQLKGLAQHSEVAIDTAQQKLSEAHAKIHMHQMFIKALGQEVLRKLHKARSAAREMQKSKEKAVDVSKGNNSLQRAQNLAKNILNLSQSDLEDIMSADGEASKPESGIETEKRRDKKWIKKCERLISSKEDFVLPLVDLFVEKIEEHCDVLSMHQIS